jgi:protein phosphatase
MVPDDRIAEILLARSSLKQAAKNLIDAANENGGRDNITVVLVRLGEGEAAGDDPDTLSGRETNVAISIDDVGEAAATTKPSPTQTTKASEPRDLTRVGDATMVLDAEAARGARAAEAPARASPPSARPAHPRRRRRAVAAVVASLVAAAVLVGLYAGSRQFWFVGTNDQGLLTLYQGLPYELPLGLDLYTEEYVSSIPASSIRDERRRERVIDHQLRSRGDAVDLIRQYERPRTGS